MITDNFNTNIHFPNSHDFNKRVLYIKTQIVLQKEKVSFLMVIHTSIIECYNFTWFEL